MKVILNVIPQDIPQAAQLAVDAIKNYLSAISPKDKVEFKKNGTSFFVHETKTGTVVVGYKSPKK